MALGTGMSIPGVNRVELRDLEVVENAEKMENGGETKRWQDVVEGDFANVVAENKTGIVMKTYGRRFHLRFPDGTEKTYSAEELKFIHDDKDFENGGQTRYEGLKVSIRPASKTSKKFVVWDESRDMIFANEKFSSEAEAKDFIDQNRMELVEKNKMAKGGQMAKGGKTKFSDKVASVKKSLLKRKKVPKSVQKDYGKTYSPAEAQESAQRIVGAMTAAERIKMRIKSKKGKK
jgi:hypothetical protein